MEGNLKHDEIKLTEIIELGDFFECNLYISRTLSTYSNSQAKQGNYWEWMMKTMMKALFVCIAVSALLPQVLGATGQPSSQPSVAPRDPAFVVYSGLSTSDHIGPQSLAANSDGSYTIGGAVNDNSLLGKLKANGQKEWFIEQNSSAWSDDFGYFGTVVMNASLYSGVRTCLTGYGYSF